VAVLVNKADDDLRQAVQRREAQHRRWQEQGERPLWKNISMVGALGWLIVAPALLGVLAGRWLDGYFETGILFSGACILLGVCVGGYFAWHRIKNES
jgi:ATP synthase protein I